ncbi:MAG: sugar transferase [Ruminococcus sp.]|nr:sugar transferase [Ruminococcus sp.]
MQKSESTKAERWELADHLAEDRLGEINKHCRDVKVRTSFYTKYIKRLFDIIISIIFLLLGLVVNIPLAIVTRVKLGKGILHNSERLGMDGKPFVMVKFRNMTNERDERGELLPAEQRVTGFGKVVRKLSLDELLNFWNILKGEMSVFGPRPLPPEYYHRYNKEHVMRLAVRPGLECPPRGKNDHIRTWQEQFDNDVWYVENVSFKTDCICIVNFVRYFLSRKNANARASAAKGIFMGYSEDGVAITLDDVPQEYIDKVFGDKTETALAE